MLVEKCNAKVMMIIKVGLLQSFNQLAQYPVLLTLPSDYQELIMKLITEICSTL